MNIDNLKREFCQLAVFRACIKLESKGMKHSRGSRLALAKRTYGFKGSYEKVLTQIQDKMDNIKAQIEEKA